MKVWRIHIKNDISDGYTRQDLFNFCKKEKIIGVGWGNIKTRDNSEDAIRREAQSYSNSVAAVKALNAVRKMQINDLIWTRFDNDYFLCRVTDLWVNSKPNDEHYKFDISNYVSVEWLEIGMEQNIPGKVLSSFRPSSSAQAVNGVENISMYIWNKYSNSDIYQIKKTEICIWSVLSAEAIEEIVLLYLQVEKGYYIYSSTVKYAFPIYECQMVNAKGQRAYPQVKSGDVTLKADDYMSAVKCDPFAEIYLFSVSESYIKNDCDRIHFIHRKELEMFVRKYSSLLPQLTYNWIDLCGFLTAKSQNILED